MSGKMVRMLSVAVIGATLLAASTTANAGVIYQDDFARTGDLSGSTPAPVDSTAANWAANTGGWAVSGGTATTGTLAGGGTFNTSNAFLPVTLSGSGTYTLSETLTPNAGTSTDWFAMGFTAGSPTNSAFYGGGVNGQLWVLYRDNGQVQSFFGGGTNNGVTGGTGTPGAADTVTLSINTVTDAFSITDSLGLVSRTGTLTGAQISSINDVGFAQYQTVAGNVSNFLLTTTVPEPTTCGSLLLVGVALIARRSRRRA